MRVPTRSSYLIANNAKGRKTSSNDNTETRQVSWRSTVGRELRLNLFDGHTFGVGDVLSCVSHLPIVRKGIKMAVSFLFHIGVAVGRVWAL